MENELIEPVNYYIEMKGKNIRKIIFNIFAMYLGIDPKDVEFLEEFINVIHQSSLVIDDIEDDSFLRRNNECAHIKYGLPLSINAAYLSIFKQIDKFNKRDDISQPTKDKVVERIYYAHIGQGMDIYYAKNKFIPTVDDYCKMIEYKTGFMFYMILDLLMEKTKNVILKQKYNELLLSLYFFSLFFQIRDDYINLTDPTYWKEKGFCQDFDEQKISYLVTYCTNFKLDNYTLINSLMTKINKTDEDKMEILKLMKNNGLLDIVYNKLLELKQNVLNIINLDVIFQQLPFHQFDTIFNTSI
uniref:Uncharacterized protein n=1 Tax=viral metagenome TaxID=1070528 RepID=A0A6C0HSP4_9ZZZZ